MKNTWYNQLINNVLDFYFEIPILCDAGIISIVWFWPQKWCLFTYNVLEKDRGNQLNIISNLIGTNVSLAGFILAALTIIITVRSSIKSRGIDNLDNALEFLLSSKNYETIVYIFRSAITEFVLCFMALYVFWGASDSAHISTVLRVFIASTTIVGLTVFRSLLLLFRLLNTENYKKP